ncbi:FAD-dependent oxidoreductase [Palleronia pelagia]|uniref:NADPH-dependent 2,4-dienoyl-CoA reductase, sulfur reductase n=1 Tax=Palleronia pelagia TaxID=387096 RepID=A0A1H8FXT7_9RHOB|nr:FAD-dependent oxidoreductase [Palleronia pelagia]SEN35898.1 NADPH-dependent 2,4-dienoyl-CoA reductase, sulfur reductase [Palleronia pelagia]
MTEHRAATLSDLPENDPTEVTAGDRKVVLVRQASSVFAVAATCPHKGVPLKMGAVKDGKLICPAHRAMFDLESGDLLAPPACESIASYPVRVDGEDVYVTVEPDQPEHPLPAHAGRGDDPRRFVILGSGAAGWRAAETLRREGFEGTINVVTDEGPVPLDRTGFSKGYLNSGETPALRDESTVAKLGIEVVKGRATGITPALKTVNLDGGVSLDYDALLIATGCDPRKLDVPGADLEGIHMIRGMADADALREDIESRAKAGPVRVAIVGAGFIGLEAATNLNKRDGVEVTVVTPEARPLAKLFGEAFGDRLLAEHREAGIEMRTGTKVTGFAGSRRVEALETEGGDSIPCDIAIVAIGAKPRTEWLPFETLQDGGIGVDDKLAVAGVEDIYAAGDIAQLPTPWGDVRIEHWRFAQELGELAARNMLGQGARYEGTPFFWSMQQPNGSYSYTGHAESWDDARGAPDGDSFQVEYVTGGRKAAVLALGFDDDLTKLTLEMAGTGPVADA